MKLFTTHLRMYALICLLLLTFYREFNPSNRFKPTSTEALIEDELQIFMINYESFMNFEGDENQKESIKQDLLNAFYRQEAMHVNDLGFEAKSIASVYEIQRYLRFVEQKYNNKIGVVFSNDQQCPATENGKKYILANAIKKMTFPDGTKKELKIVFEYLVTNPNEVKIEKIVEWEKEECTTAYNNTSNDTYEAIFNRIQTAFNRGDCASVRADVLVASSMRPNDERLRKIKVGCDDQLAFQIQAQEYDEYKRAGDLDFSQKFYSEAIKNYLKALEKKPNDQYCKDRIASCNSLIAQKADAEIEQELTRARSLIGTGRESNYPEAMRIYFHLEPSGKMKGSDYYMAGQILDKAAGNVQRALGFSARTCFLRANRMIYKAAFTYNIVDAQLFWENHFSKKARKR